MECTINTRNIVVSICLTIAAFIACYFIAQPEKETADPGMLAVYLGIVGTAIGVIGEGINFFSQKPKNTLWLGIVGGLAAGLFASAF